MSKNKKQHSDDIKGEELDVNGNPGDLNREYIGSKIKVPWHLQINLFIKHALLLFLEENQ